MKLHSAPEGLLASSRRAARRRLPVGIVAAAVVGSLAGGVGAWSLATPRPAAVEAARPVALVYRDDGAHQVAVAGTFNGWNADVAPMSAMGGGVFRVVLWLPPGRYEYQFVVDGSTWIADPTEPRHSDDGFGSANSVLDL